ncbi:hypothetical protein SASPL_106726 [Salvia splendens]|uniref:Uncharacterized protein n=1 Tax=Salvia splendens TaxID=180675 RepID=A0A8X8YRV1_SALSN|nr:hypothetical protein SASPL_106726 [Salvia splendens]
MCTPMARRKMQSIAVKIIVCTKIERPLVRMLTNSIPLLPPGSWNNNPGLVLQLPGKNKPVEFLNMKTSVLAIVLHAVIYGLLLVLFLVMLDIHIYA